jgi:hypothetical protein
MAKGLLEDRVTNGCSDWCTWLAFTLAIVLQVALNVRIGDISAPDGGHGYLVQKPALRYSDVKLVLGGGGSIADIKGQWEIRNANNICGNMPKAYSPRSPLACIWCR